MNNDLISRQAVFDAIEELKKIHFDRVVVLNKVRDRVLELSSVNPQEPCSNCCNGNQIEKAKLCQKSYLAGMEHKQQPKTGHWILTSDDDYEYCTCSECGYQNGENWMIGSQIKYCQECGCRMFEPQESEDI